MRYGSEYTKPLQTNADINHLFDKRVAPQLRSLEKERLAAVAQKWRSWRNGLVVLGGIIYAVYLVGQAYDWHWLIPLIPTVIGGFIVWVWGAVATSDYEERLRKTFMTAICEAVGNLRYVHEINDVYDDVPDKDLDEISDPFEEFDLTPFVDAHLVPSHDDVELEDFLIGRYKDCDFTLVEAELTSTRRTNRGSTIQTVFDGLLFQLDVPKKVNGRIIIMRDYGSWLNTMRGWWRDGERIEIPHEEFERKYEVHADSREFALKVITPAFAENFLALSRVFGSDKLRAAFIDKKFLLSIGGVTSFLEGFSANTPATELKDLFKKIVKEVKMVHRVIDELHKG